MVKEFSISEGEKLKLKSMSKELSFVLKKMPIFEESYRYNDFEFFLRKEREYLVLFVYLNNTVYFSYHYSNEKNDYTTSFYNYKFVESLLFKEQEEILVLYAEKLFLNKKSAENLKKEKKFKTYKEELILKAISLNHTLHVLEKEYFWLSEESLYTSRYSLPTKINTLLNEISASINEKAANEVYEKVVSLIKTYEEAFIFEIETNKKNELIKLQGLLKSR